MMMVSTLLRHGDAADIQQPGHHQDASWDMAGDFSFNTCLLREFDASGGGGKLRRMVMEGWRRASIGSANADGT